MKSQEFKMPAFGVGPIYVLTCLFLTMIGVYLHIKGFLSAGEFTEGKNIFYCFWNSPNTIWLIFMDRGCNSSKNK